MVKSTPAAQGQAPHLPVEQSMVQMFAEPLQDLVVVSDGRRLIFTGSKVALQLQKEETGWLKRPPTAHRGGRWGCQHTHSQH